MSPSTGRRKLLTFIVIILIIISSILVLKRFIGREWLRSYVRNKIEAMTNNRLVLRDVKIEFFPYISIVGDNIVFYGDGDTELLTSPNVRIDLEFWSVIVGRPVIKNLLINAPVLYLEMERDGRLNLLKAISDTDKRNPIVVRRLDVRDGRLLFRDNTVSPSKTIEIRRLNLKVKIPLLIGDISFDIRGLIGTNERFGELEIDGKANRELEPLNIYADGKISSLDSSIPAPYLKRKYGIELVKGDLDMEFLFNGGVETGFVSGDIRSKGVEFRFKPYYPKPLSPEGFNTTFTMEYGKNDLDVKEFDINIDGVRLNGRFRLDTKKREIDGRFKTTTFTHPWLLTYMPELKGWQPSGTLGYIKTGSITIDELSFKGSFDDFVSKESFIKSKPLSARVSFHDLKLRIDKGLKPLRALKGSISIQGDLLRFKGLKGSYGDTVINDLSGSIKKTFTPNPEIDIKLRSNIDLLQAPELIASLQPEWKERSEVIDIKGGKAQVDLRLHKVVGKRGMGLKGDISFEGLDLIYIPEKTRLTGIEGRFSFADRDISIEVYKGAFQNSLFSLNGMIKRYNSTAPELLINLNYSLFGRDLKTLLPFNTPEQIDIEGIAPGELSISGNTKDIMIKGSIDLKDTAYGYPAIAFKSKGMPNTIEFEGRYQMDGNISNLRITDIIMDQSIYLIADVKDINRLDGRWQIDFNDIDLSKIQDILVFSSSYGTKGTIKGSLILNGALLEWYALKIYGEVKALSLSFTPSADSVPIKDLTLTTRFKGDFMEAPHIYLKRGRSVLEGSLSINGFKNPEVNLNVHSSIWRNIDFPPNEKIKRMVKQFLKGGKLKGRIDIESGRLDKVVFQSLSTNIEMKRGVWQITPLKIVLEDGMFKGGIRIDELWPGKTRVRLEGVWDNADIEKVLKEWFEKEKIITGRFHSIMSLSFLKSDGKTDPRSINGSVSIEFKNGRIFKLFNIMPKLLGLLNPLRVITLDLPNFTKKGMLYKKARADFVIKKGVIHTNNIVIDGKEMRILWVGSVDIKKNTIDSFMAVQPFETVDKILGNTVGRIPLIGEIIVGKDRKLLVLYYKVEGDLKDPDVRGMNVEGIGRGILDRFRILLPIGK